MTRLEVLILIGFYPWSRLSAYVPKNLVAMPDGVWKSVSGGMSDIPPSATNPCWIGPFTPAELINLLDVRKIDSNDPA